MKTIRKKKPFKRNKTYTKKIPIDDVGAFGDNITMCIIAKTKGSEEEMVGLIQF
jgi:hypothetical protein